LQNKENEVIHKQQQHPLLQVSQSDFVDEIFYHEVEERAKKADQEKRETARRARDYYHGQSLQPNVCFDTNKQITFTLQPIPLNRTIPFENKVDIELDDRETPAFPLYPSEEPNINQESLVNVEHQRS